MSWLNILYLILGIIATLATTVLPLVIKFIKAVKAYKAAKTEAEAEKAYNDMLATAQSLIKAAEVAFEGYDKVMKAQGSSAGSMKKNDVTSKLQVYALSHGYTYDAEFWSAKIDEIVNFTREVNATSPNVIAPANSNARTSNPQIVGGMHKY